MVLDEIAKEMPQRRTRLVINQSGSQMVRRVRLGSEPSHAPRAGVLYIVDLSEIDGCPGGNYACVARGADTSERFENFPGNLLLIEEDVAPKDLYEEINAILAAEREYDLKSRKLLEMVQEGKSIEQILSAVYRLFGNVLTLEDQAWNLLYCSREDDLDPLVTTELASQDTDTYYSNVLNITNSLGNPYHWVSDTPFEFPLAGYSTINKAMGLPVIVDHEVVAEITLYEYKHPFNGSDVRLLRLLANVLSYKMQKDGYDYPTDRLKFESLMLDIHSRRLTDPIIIQDRLRSSNIDPQGMIYALVLRIEEEKRGVSNIYFLLKKLRQRLPEAHMVAYDNQIILLVTQTGVNPTQTVDMELLNGFMAENFMHGGISGRFDTLQNLGHAYQQAVKSLEIGQRLGIPERIVSFEDLTIYHILELVEAQTDLTAYLHPAVTALMEYDRLQGTSYTSTLAIYVRNLQNQLQASKELNISRSTLAHRVNKIVELTRIDLLDADTLFHLRLSFKILEFSRVH